MTYREQTISEVEYIHYLVLDRTYFFTSMEDFVEFIRFNVNELPYGGSLPRNNMYAKVFADIEKEDIPGGFEIAGITSTTKFPFYSIERIFLQYLMDLFSKKNYKTFVHKLLGKPIFSLETIKLPKTTHGLDLSQISLENCEFQPVLDDASFRAKLISNFSKERSGYVNKDT